MIPLLIAVMFQTHALQLGQSNITFFDHAGDPLRGGKVYVYSDVPVKGAYGVTYWDEDGRFPNANPVMLDSWGRAAIWIRNDAPPLRIMVYDAHDHFEFERLDILYFGTKRADTMTPEQYLEIALIQRTVRYQIQLAMGLVVLEQATVKREREIAELERLFKK